MVMPSLITTDIKTTSTKPTEAAPSPPTTTARSAEEADEDDEKEVEDEEASRELIARYTSADTEYPEPLEAIAFQGLPSKITEIISPKTEASRDAILINCLLMFGFIAGRTFVKGNIYLNEFAVFAGRTGKDRKGTALD